VLPIADLLGEAIVCIHTNESVSKLFEVQAQQPLLPLKSNASAKAAAQHKSAPETQKKTAEKIAVTSTTEKRKSGERSYAKAN
jgi:hypothetical protein